MLAQKQNLGYLIAAIGAILGLIGFFALPYVLLTITISASFLGISTSQPYTGAVSTFDVANRLGYGVIWLALILTIVGLGIALYQLFVGNASSDTQAVSRSRLLATVLIVAGVIVIAINAYIALDAPHKTPEVMNALAGGANTDAAALLKSLVNITASASYGAGGWLFLVGAVLLIVGGVLGLIYKPMPLVMAEVPSWPAAGQPQIPSWPAPEQNAPTQYGQPYPPQSYPQQPYPPTQQQPPQ